MATSILSIVHSRNEPAIEKVRSALNGDNAPCSDADVLCCLCNGADGVYYMFQATAWIALMQQPITTNGALSPQLRAPPFKPACTHLSRIKPYTCTMTEQLENYCKAMYASLDANRDQLYLHSQ